jgi:hypothetical protein
MTVDPALPEDLRTALAMVRAHVTGDADGWQVLAEHCGEPADLATALVRIAGVCAQFMLGEAQSGRYLDPAAVDELLDLVARAFAHEAAR